MNKIILVVDDDEDITLIIEEILKQHDYEVLVAHDGPHAVEKTQQHRVDLVLMDIRMPNFSGLWFCEIFKRKPQTRNIPVVVISSAFHPEDIEKARQLGVKACLKKPFDSEELLAVVEKAIA